MEAFEGKTRLILVNYPYHYRDYSFGAAEALLSAGEQGKYWEMHDLLMEKSPDLSPARLVEYAAQLDLDMVTFKKNLDDMKHKEEIDADVQLAKDLDFYNTPTFIINGRVVIGNRPYKYLEKIVEEELKRVGK
jgi:protein-disulfide isomerase